MAELRRCSRPGHGPRRASRSRDSSDSEARHVARLSARLLLAPVDEAAVLRNPHLALEPQRSDRGAAELKGLWAAAPIFLLPPVALRLAASAQAARMRRRGGSPLSKSGRGRPRKPAAGRPPAPPPAGLDLPKLRFEDRGEPQRLSPLSLLLRFAVWRKRPCHLHRIISSLLCDSESAARSQSLYSLDLCLLSSSLLDSLSELLILLVLADLHSTILHI